MKSKTTEIIILGNPLNHEGGMVMFNKGLIDTLNKTKNGYHLKHFSIGSRMSLFYYPTLKKIVYPFILIYDIIRLCFVLPEKKIKIIQLNPSLIPVPLLRDGIVQLLNTLIFKKKSVIVLHGWKEHVYDKIINNKPYKYLVLNFFNSANIIFVLSEDFKLKLIALGIEESKIKITRTFFYSQDIIKPSKSQHKTSKVKFIFLGRVSKLKGISELIEAFDLVSKYNNDFICEIVGHGDNPVVITKYRQLVEQKGLKDKIVFLGRKIGPEKYALLSSSDVYVFPSYMEGCPTSVIEGMASGLFVVSTDVGALNEIVNTHNGIKIKPKEVEELKQALLYCLENINEIRNLKSQIIKNSNDNFEVSIISKSFETTYNSILKNEKLA